MGRSPNSSSSDESGVKKGPWTPEEDDKLIKYIQQHGHGSWRALPKLAGLNRCGKSCRLRWTNYLRPDIKRGKFSQDEEQTILNLHAILGNKWSAIATHLPGRTDNEIKNFWNTHLKKKLIQMGFDPMTHRPRTDLFSALPQLVALANLIDYAPPLWDSDALQFARLNHFLQSLLIPSPPSAAVAPFPNINNVNANFSHLETASPDLQAVAAAVGLGLDQPISAAAGFSHLPGLQTVDNNDGGYCAATCDLGSVSGGGESSMWTQKNLMMQSPAAAPVSETPVSTASYGGDQIWAELSDIFPDIA